METEIPAITMMGGGIAISLVAAYQLYRKGFITWMLLLIIGVTSVNYGYNNKNANIDSLLDQMNAKDLTMLSKAKLEEACQSLEIP